MQTYEQELWGGPIGRRPLLQSLYQFLHHRSPAILCWKMNLEQFPPLYSVLKIIRFHPWIFLNKLLSFWELLVDLLVSLRCLCFGSLLLDNSMVLMLWIFVYLRAYGFIEVSSTSTNPCHQYY
ncbi:hypothetical protein ABFS82_09G063800 [Erythranthe guttata]|uniref:Uncharacterized protein n=1 Tax=Erythranthe guttata TaxID=4155 RepID=A0A022RRD6_ERYGU|nr:hypothetical protein MIMGU_mgv1a016433mg [Erythranthe guttata]